MGGVTPHGIRYPDGASKAKNLGPELKTMAEDIDHVFTDTLEGSVIHEIVEGIAEEAVDEAIADENIVRAFPEEDTVYSSQTSVPLHWVHKAMRDTYSDTYSDTYTGAWEGSSRRAGDVPILTKGGFLRSAQIPASIARTADVLNAAEVRALIDAAMPENAVAEKVVNRDLPIFGARVAKAHVTSSAVAAVVVGSSTAAANPGFVARLAALTQAAYLPPSGAPTTPQWSTSADFTQIAAAGIHFYSAAQGGTTSGNYLPNSEIDKIASLRPAVMLHLVGANDYYLNVAPPTFKANMLARLAYADSAFSAPCQHVLVQTYPRWGGANDPAYTYPWDDYRDALAEVADERRQTTVLVDLSPAYAANDVSEANHSDPLDLISGDDTHQTAAGYRFMADQLSTYFVS